MRALGRVQTIEDIEQIVVTIREGRPVTLAQIAKVTAGAQSKRGDSAAYSRDNLPTGKSVSLESESAPSLPLGDHSSLLAQGWSGGPCVVLTINKQPGADTRAVTDNVFKAIEDLSASLPKDIQVIPLYSQKSFIDRAIENVVVALRDGVILVVIILVLFLMNVRTTFITLTAR